MEARIAEKKAQRAVPKKAGPNPKKKPRQTPIRVDNPKEDDLFEEAKKARIAQLPAECGKPEKPKAESWTVLDPDSKGLRIDIEKSI